MSERYNRSGRGGARTDDRRPRNDGDRVSKGDRRGGGGADIIVLDDHMMTSTSGAKKKFTGRCRLFIGSLPQDYKEPELRELFKPFGEISECFISPRGFAFVKMDSRAHAELAKETLDMHYVKGRPIRVRFAVHGAALRVKELSPFVSNELLEAAFSQFGPVERAVHIVDDKGRPTGEGFVEFERKSSAAEALKRITDGVFMLTSAPHPILVEPLEQRDEDDGLAERMIPQTNVKNKEREHPPRFAMGGSFELEFGQRWKEIYQLERMRREQLDQELREHRERLEADMDIAYQDYQTHLMREELRRRQEELEVLENAKAARMADMQRRDEERRGRMGASSSFGSSFANDFGPARGFETGPPAHHMMQNSMFDHPPPMQFGELGGGGGGNAPGNDMTAGVQKLLQMFKGGMSQQQSLMDTVNFGQPQSQFGQMGGDVWADAQPLSRARGGGGARPERTGGGYEEGNMPRGGNMLGSSYAAPRDPKRRRY